MGPNIGISITTANQPAFFCFSIWLFATAIIDQIVKETAIIAIINDPIIKFLTAIYEFYHFKIMIVII